jgi:RNA polymerase sigma factor (sigma-70 family)
MVWTSELDAQVVELLRKQSTLEINSENYYENRSLIVELILKSLRPALMSCVYNWKNKYRIDESDGESLIYQNLLHTINTYNPEKANGMFIKFFWNVNSSMFKNYLTKIYAQKRTPQAIEDTGDKMQKTFFAISSLSSPVNDISSTNSSNDYSDVLESVIRDPNSFEQCLEYKATFKKLYSRATPKQKRVLKRLFFGRTYSEIGKSLSMSVPQVYNLLKKMKIKNQDLKNEL